MADYEGNGLAAFNDARSRGWSGSVTLADLEKLSAGNPIMQGIAAVWPDAPQSKPQSSVDWLRQYLPSSMGDWLARSEAEGLQWGKDMSNPRNAAGEVISTAMNLVPMGRLAMPRQGIRAYHGSPYDFDRFDLSKIGTGEGAQSYGHGLYFAESPKTAQSYRDALQGKAPVAIEGSAGDARWILENAVREARKHGPDQASRTAAANAWLDETIETMRGKFAPQGGLANAIEAKRLLQEGTVKPDWGTAGKMYEVNINAKPEQFLDWDAKVRDMPHGVQSSLSKLGWNIQGPDQGLVGSQVVNRGMDAGGASAASRAMNDAGIPGIRYLDAGSRGREGKQTNNYVLFNDKIVDIMKKWSLAGAIPFAAASDYDGRF